MGTTTIKAGPWNMTVFAFDQGDTDNPLAGLGPDEISRLPYGAIELDQDGKVVAYNDTEPDGAGSPRLPMVGRDFFAEVARWAGATVVGQEFRKGVAARDLNVVFDCAAGRKDYKVRIHLKISPILGTYWAFIKKLRRSA